jgi:toxin ParE1/3/4
MAFQVVVTDDAERDFEDFVTHKAKHDSPRSAEHSLAGEPTRGSSSKELRALGDKEYRQVFFKPYRLIYRMAEQQVIIYLIAGGLLLGVRDWLAI